MVSRRFAAAGARRPAAADYALALGFAGVAVLCRAGLEMVAPGIGYFVVLLPAVVLGGVFCGTLPALLAGIAGGGAISLLFLHHWLTAWPNPSAAQLDALLFLPACATVLWATHSLRRSADAALQAEARLAEVFRQIPGAAAILEAPSGRLLLRSVNSGMVLGHDQHAVQGTADMAAYGGVHPDGTHFAGDDYPIVRALKTGEMVRGQRIRYQRPDGSMADLEVHAGPVRAPDGAILASVGMAFDVTERVGAERRLQESEAQFRAMAERLRAAIDAGALGLWELDIDAGVYHLDAAFAAILGRPPAPIELTREELRSLIDPADRERAHAKMTATLAESGIYADEMRMRTAQGVVRWLVSRGTVLRDMNKVIGVVSDVTERRGREDALEEALRARDVLMHEADHRIKNSLQLVVSLLRLQLSRADDLAIKQALAEAVARVDAVANAHLALQRSPDLRSMDLDRMLEDLCTRMAALNPSIAMQCRAETGISMDAEQAIPLGLIASELMTNALRHAYPAGAEGEVALSIRKVGGRREAGQLEMIVADGGAGLSGPARRPGLGSTVVNTLARQIGAAVATHSHPGEGTVVTVTLPVSGPAMLRGGVVSESAQVR
jgi:PAS domain S-box-containing protein